ncbi:hypothetical protein Droror1_Dr00018249 [Drosera rotundifolia]
MLCPRHLKEWQFWRINFILVKSFVTEYELRAIQLEKLKTVAMRAGFDSFLNSTPDAVFRSAPAKYSLIGLMRDLRGIDEDTWRQHVTGGKLREITEEAKSFAIGNKSLAALLIHTPTGELQRDIRSWLAENFSVQRSHKA